MIIYEIRHLLRNPFKWISILLFTFAAFYALETGYQLSKKQNATIKQAIESNEKQKMQVLDWFDKNQSGPENRPWVDVKTPFWAIWHTPSLVYKAPSTMMTFSIGQAENYGFYKNTTFWSTTFDNDLSEELANPERLAIGSLDFSFVILFLLPILLIVLLYDVGGLEKERSFDKLVVVQSGKWAKWLSRRFFIYLILMGLLILLVMLVYGFRSQAIGETPLIFFQYYLLVFIYLVAWISLFFLVNLYGKGIRDQSLKMISLWILFCLLMPGFSHQVVSYKYPNIPMTEFIDAKREDSRSAFKFGYDSLKSLAITAVPDLGNTTYAKDTLLNTALVNNTASAVANHIIKPVSNDIETRMEEKNQAIQSFYIVNPIGFFMNKFNAFAQTDFYSYQDFRREIQAMIDAKTSHMAIDTWNYVVVDKEKYKEYLNTFSYDDKQ